MVSYTETFLFLFHDTSLMHACYWKGVDPNFGLNLAAIVLRDRLPVGHKSAKENIVVRFLRKKLFAPFLMKPFLQGSLQLRGLYLNRVAFVDDICGICFVFVKITKKITCLFL